MHEQRDVASATRPVVEIRDLDAASANPLARIEQQPLRQQPTDTRAVEGMIFNRDQIELLKRTIAKDATDDELDLFLYQCRRTRLDPFTRQCYFMKRRAYDKSTRRYVDRFTFETSIDGFRLIAERTGKYAGQLAPEWADVQHTKEGVVVITWFPVWPFGTTRNPYAARVGVLRKDFDQPLVAVARWDAYAQMVDVWENDQRTDEQRLNAMWEKRGAEQLAKCAESLALRQAFPNELSGVYTSEEMGQAENDRGDDDVLDERKAAASPQRETKRRGTKQERSDKADRLHRREPANIFAGLSVSRYASKFPFGAAPLKGAALDQNLLDDHAQPIAREYVVGSEKLARAYEWAVRALDGKQTVDEVVDGEKTGKKLPVVLDADGVKRFERLRDDVAKEVERRQLERDDVLARGDSTQQRPVVHDNTAADDAREQLAEEKGEAYEGD